MTTQPPQDPLAALWQTAPASDTAPLLQDLQRVNRTHRRLSWTARVILCGTALLLVVEAVTERSLALGALSGVWILGLALGFFWYRRARCNRAEAMIFDTVRLLRFMIARAKKDLRIARFLYAGAPLGALIGILVARLCGFAVSQNLIAASPQAHLLRIGVAATALMAMVTIGVFMARDRRLQLRDLEEQLSAIEEDL